jgi:signal peptidase I
MRSSIIILFAAAAGLITWTRRWLTVATVHGASMKPTLTDGQRVLARRCRRYRVDDIIVFRAPQRIAATGDPTYRVKRIAAIAGDPLPPALRAAGLPATVPSGHVAVTGDGPGSEDSRHLGCVPRSAIIGRITRRRPGTRCGSCRLQRSIHSKASDTRVARSHRYACTGTPITP